MNKSLFAALSLGILFVSSYLCPVTHGKPADPMSNLCCRTQLPCCQDQAVAVESTILGERHDARAGAEEHYTRDEAFQEGYPKRKFGSY